MLDPKYFARTIDFYLHLCANIHMSALHEFPWELFKALGEPNRYQLFCKLCGCDCPCTVSEVAEWAPQDISVISRHLKQLKDAGVVDSSKQGRENYYRVNASQLAQTLRALADALENCECCQSEKGGGCCE